MNTLRWYVVQARSGFERIVASALKERIARFGLEEHFGQILVPAEEVVEMRAGQKRRSERKFFPGYVLVQIDTTVEGMPKIHSEAWHVVRETEKVLGFIGGTAERPFPITEKEADAILSRVQKAAAAPQVSSRFKAGDQVRVTDGPFNDFNGIVEEVAPEKGKVKVAVLIFGRSTSIDLGFNQVEKV